MNTIPTAKELFDKMISENDEVTSTEMMIEFAKLHVQAALKTAANEATTKFIPFTDDEEVDKYSILTAYSLDKIK